MTDPSQLRAAARNQGSHLTRYLAGPFCTQLAIRELKKWLR